MFKCLHNNPDWGFSHRDLKDINPGKYIISSSELFSSLNNLKLIFDIELNSPTDKSLNINPFYTSVA